MRVKSWCGLGVSLVLSFVLTIPAELPAAGQSTNQRAGEISRVIPAANISRGPKTLNASTKTQVDWLDKVNTQAGDAGVTPTTDAGGTSTTDASSQ